MSAGEVLLSEVQRSINRQEASLDSLRERTGRVLAAALVISGLFAVATRHTDGFQTVSKGYALWLLVVLVALTVLIEWPRRFNFEQILRKTIEDVDAAKTAPGAPGGYDAEDAALPLAMGLDASHDANEATLNVLTILYKATLLVVLLQVVVWAVTAL